MKNLDELCRIDFKHNLVGCKDYDTINKALQIAMRHGMQLEAYKTDTLLEALKFYASIDPDKPSAALAADKFQLAKDVIKQLEEDDAPV